MTKWKETPRQIEQQDKTSQDPSAIDWVFITAECVSIILAGIALIDDQVFYCITLVTLAIYFRLNHRL